MLRLTRLRFSYFELFGQVGGPLAPDGGRHLLALLLGGKDALLVGGVAVVGLVVLFADVLALVHGLRVTEDAEAEGRRGEGNGCSASLSAVPRLGDHTTGKGRQ